MPTDRNSSTGPTFDERTVLIAVGCAGQGLGMIDMPFRGSEALRRGDVTRNDLSTRYRPMFRDVYIPRDVELTAAMKARAAWLSTGATLAGLSAAAVLGTKWLDVHAPADCPTGAPAHAGFGACGPHWNWSMGVRSRPRRVEYGCC